MRRAFFLIQGKIILVPDWLRRKRGKFLVLMTFEVKFPVIKFVSTQLRPFPCFSHIVPKRSVFLCFLVGSFSSDYEYDYECEI
jgi:hypothetical protein